MLWQPSSKRCSVSSAASSHHKGDRRLCGGFARVNERLGSHMGMDELIDLFAEGDELVSNTAFEDLDLAYDVANGATFDGVVFRSCEFDGVDWSGSSFARGCFAVAALSAATWKAVGSIAATSSIARHRDSTCSGRVCRVCRLDRAT